MSSSLDPAPGSDRDHKRGHGTDILTRVAALLRVGRTYTTQNQLFQQQLEMLVETSRPYLREWGEMLFVAYGKEIFLDGVRIAMTSQGYRLAQGLVQELEQRGIKGFEVVGEPTRDDWRTFFELLLDPKVEPGKKLLAEARARGLERVLPVLGVLEDFAEGEGEDGGAGATEPSPSPDSPTQTRANEKPETQAGALGGRVSPVSLAALGSAPKRYAAALVGLRSLLMSTNSRRGLEVRHARRVVQPIVDAVTSHEPVVLGLAGLIKRDEFTYARNVNACMIATTMGENFGFDRATLANLSVSALLHGIGRSLTTDPALIGAAGVRILARRSSMQEATVKIMRVAFEAGAGPAPPGHSSVLSQIVGIAAMYTRMCTSRAEVGKTTTPVQALGMIVGPLTGGFDPALKVALVEAIGYHPPGQIVALDDGALAMVIACNRDDLSHPVLQPITGPGGRPLDAGTDWAGGLLPPERAIARDLMATEIPEDLDLAA